MTNLTPHCTDLETSRQLKGIGCPRTSNSWHDGANYHVPCWLLSELIEILGDKFGAVIQESGGTWFCTYLYEGGLPGAKGITPIQAVANLIIKLNEEGILVFNKSEI